MKTKQHHGSNFDEFLQEEGLLEEVQAAAMKKVLALAFSEAIKARKTKLTELAKRMGTSRSALARILDENNTSITLRNISRTASALGYRVRLELEPA